MAGEVFRCRIDGKLLSEAEKVTKDIGTTPGEVVRLLFKQLVKRRTIPFPLDADAQDGAGNGLVDVKRRNKVLRELDDSKGW